MIGCELDLICLVQDSSKNLDSAVRIATGYELDREVEV
jgi:hypothetical protein